jgi:solute carrier family 25 carnitine/acylcarnitine transporter 20/29
MKTLMQTDDLENKKYKNMRDVFVQRLKEGGVKTFYKGLGVTLIRAIFVNAGAFFAFEGSMRAMGRTESSE